MSGHDPLDSVRAGVQEIRRGTSLAAPPPPAALDTGRAGTPSVVATDDEADDAPQVDVTAPSPDSAAPARRRSTAARNGGAAKKRAGATEADDLPGFARGSRRQIGVGLTEATFEALRGARGSGRSNGDVVLDALRGTHVRLVESYAPSDDDGDDLFPVQPRRRRRLDIEGVRRMEFMCSPAEAAVIGELAERCDLSLSALIEAALALHLGVDTAAT
jgi:hypothetical protein